MEPQLMAFTFIQFRICSSKMMINHWVFRGFSFEMSGNSKVQPPAAQQNTVPLHLSEAREASAAVRACWWWS